MASGKGGRELADGTEHGKLSRGIKKALDVTEARAGKLADSAEWVLGRRAARLLGAVTLFAVMVALLFLFLNWYVAPAEPSDKKDLVLALAQILAGTALLLGLYFTWRTLQVNREGQITDRFTRAVDQLGATDDDGSRSLEIRVGGIYALERIARDSEKDHWPIMQLLTAYARQHAHLRQPNNVEGEKGTTEEASEKDSKTERTSDYASPLDPDVREEQRMINILKRRSHLDPDIQAIMTVLRRRTRSYGNGEPEPIDLRETDLLGAFLRDVNLTQATLWGTNLLGAFLRGANFNSAYLFRANLTEADLASADLSEAKLWDANLTSANLRQADLSGAELSGAKLSEAHLSRADLSRADLWQVELSGANLQGTIGLTQGQLERALGDETTQLPGHLTHPYSWTKKLDERTSEDQPQEDSP